MPFTKYKASHGGRGPVEDLYARATGGEGLFGRLGLREERTLTDQLIADVSGHEEFRGLAGMLEVGRSPLTREQHAEFRSGIMQAALNTRVLNAGLDEYQTRTAQARAQAVGKEDLLMLDNFDAMAAHAQRLAASGNSEKAQEVFGSVMQNFGAYVARNEEQRLELESSDEAGRETIRKELQTQLNKLADPLNEDTANYGSIREQLEGHAGEEVADPSLVSAVLEYAGAALRQSDDGNWSFAIGPLGLSDTNLPAMTYSQIRNRLEAAYKGRSQSLREAAGRISTEADKRGFGLNGSRVDDLLFPLANAAYRERETESKPPSATSPANLQRVNDKVTQGLSDVGHTLMPNIVNGVSRGIEWLFDAGEPDTTPGDLREGNTRRGRGSVSGVIRRPTND
jgi:hypothetical protein